ncbi:MAG: hypothetical protein KF773_07190 [Deltaproteobacteria bacterium]|nr:hypothetical protein [Deltaproteobacteria bacterium]MCW5806206.1 hypothetical protein [Deltaproteobacteria bacterium]
MTLRPGLLFAIDGPRAVHEIATQVEVLEFVRHSDEPSISFRAGYRAQFTPGPRSQVVLQANGQSGVVTAIQARSAADQTIVQVQPAGRVDSQNADATQLFGYEISRELRFNQTLFARASRTDDNGRDPATQASDPTITQSYDVGAALGIERVWVANSLSFEVGTSWLRLEREASSFIDAMNDPLTRSRLDRQINPRARATWRHDFNQRWSTAADGGVVVVFPYGPRDAMADAAQGVFPTGGLAVSFAEVWGRTTLAVRRDVAPNLLLAQNSVNSTAALSFVLPLPFLQDPLRQPRLIALASVGVGRTELIDAASADVVSRIDNGRLDFAVGYTPRPGFTYGVRYELVLQSADDRSQLANIQGFSRSQLSFTFQLTYPNRIGTDPLRRATQGVRADRSDAVPLGVEQVVPEVPDGEGGGGGGNGMGSGGDGNGGDDE